MIDLVDGVINLLKNNVEVSKYVGGRIYWIKPPSESPQLPMITVIESGNAEIESSDDDEYADEVEIQVDIWAKSDFKPIAQSVQKVMRNEGYTHTAGPDEYIDEIKVFHKAIRFTTEVTI
jgi:hypothetical protein